MGVWMGKRLLLFDLDGTLLTSDKRITKASLDALEACRKRDYLVGLVTSRCEFNFLEFTGTVRPDILIGSGGAMIKYKGRCIYNSQFTADETASLIQKTKEIFGTACGITIDTTEAYYWFYETEADVKDISGKHRIVTDVRDFCAPMLRMCVESHDLEKMKAFETVVPDISVIPFSDDPWSQLTRSDVGKETAIRRVSEYLSIPMSDVTAFGDDFVDIGMLRMAGTGVAMGNAVPEAKAAADIVIGTNDDDGIAVYLEEMLGKTD